MKSELWLLLEWNSEFFHSLFPLSLWWSFKVLMIVCNLLHKIQLFKPSILQFKRTCIALKMKLFLKCLLYDSIIWLKWCKINQSLFSELWMTKRVLCVSTHMKWFHVTLNWISLHFCWNLWWHSMCIWVVHIFLIQRTMQRLILTAPLWYLIIN